MIVNSPRSSADSRRTSLSLGFLFPLPGIKYSHYVLESPPDIVFSSISLFLNYYSFISDFQLETFENITISSDSFPSLISFILIQMSPTSNRFLDIPPRCFLSSATHSTFNVIVIFLFALISQLQYSYSS